MPSEVLESIQDTSGFAPPSPSQPESAHSMREHQGFIRHHEPTEAPSGNPAGDGDDSFLTESDDSSTPDSGDSMSDSGDSFITDSGGSSKSDGDLMRVEPTSVHEGTRGEAEDEKKLDEHDGPCEDPTGGASDDETHDSDESLDELYETYDYACGIKTIRKHELRSESEVGSDVFIDSPYESQNEDSIG